MGCNPHAFIDVSDAHILRAEMLYLRMRVVNVTDLLMLENKTAHPHRLDAEMFNTLFTPDQPVIINFYDYPLGVKQLLLSSNTRRFHINGYREESTTTTRNDYACP